MSKKKPLPKYLEGTIDCKQGLCEAFLLKLLSENICLLGKGPSYYFEYFQCQCHSLYQKQRMTTSLLEKEEKLKPNKGRRESCPLQCRR